MRLALTRTLPLLAALALPLTGCFDRHGNDGGCPGPPPSNVADLTRGEWFLIGSASTATASVFRPQAEVQRGQYKYAFAPTGSYTYDVSECDPSVAIVVGTYALQGQTLTLRPTGGAVQVKQIVRLSPAELQLTR